MCPYLKLAVALLAPLLCWRAGRTQAAADLLLGARFAWVNACGTPADRERLIDDISRTEARASGNMELYRAGVRFRARLAALRAAGVPDEEALAAATAATAQERGNVEGLCEPTPSAGVTPTSGASAVATTDETSGAVRSPAGDPLP